MTEAEWLAATDPRGLFDTLACQASPPTERKWRLLMAGSARQVWDHIPIGLKREAVEAAERYADGGMTEEELRRFGTEYYKIDEWVKAAGPGGFRIHALAYASTASMRNISRLHLSTYWVGLSRLAGPAFSDLIRCVMGNPHRKVSCDPTSFHLHAVAIAQGIYDERAFDGLHILADALQDAGCENADILSHLRSDGPHVRGCWALDLVLRKE